jgi:transketolase
VDATDSIERFGASAISPLCMETFGFTVENVVAPAKGMR